MAYRIEYSPDAEDHLRVLTKREQVIILAAVERQLIQQPASPTRNRKPMRPNEVAPWELRIGDFRVYYDIRDRPESVVVVCAVGVKLRNRVRIGKKVIDL